MKPRPTSMTPALTDSGGKDAARNFTSEQLQRPELASLCAGEGSNPSRLVSEIDEVRYHRHGHGNTPRAAQRAALRRTCAGARAPARRAGGTQHLGRGNDWLPGGDWRWSPFRPRPRTSTRARRAPRFRPAGEIHLRNLQEDRDHEQAEHHVPRLQVERGNPPPCRQARLAEQAGNRRQAGRTNRDPHSEGASPRLDK